MSRPITQALMFAMGMLSMAFLPATVLGAPGGHVGRPRLVVLLYQETASADGIVVDAGVVDDILSESLRRTGRFKIVSASDALLDFVAHAPLDSVGFPDFAGLPASVGQDETDFILQGRINDLVLPDSGSFGVILLNGLNNHSPQRLVLECCMVNASTGTTVCHVSGRSEGQSAPVYPNDRFAYRMDARRAACADLTGQIEATGHWPVRAVVTGIDNGRVVIDLGAAAGLRPGMKLELRPVVSVLDESGGALSRISIGERYATLELDSVAIDHAVGHVTKGGPIQRGSVAQVPKGTTLTRPDDSAH